MNRDQVKGRVKQVEGKTKEVAGKVVGDKEMENDVKAKKHVGKIQSGEVDARHDVKKQK